MSGWLLDPATKEPLPARPGENPRDKWSGHWRPGWRSGIERDENGVPLRVWFAECPDECCKEIRAESGAQEHPGE